MNLFFCVALAIGVVYLYSPYEKRGQKWQYLLLGLLLVIFPCVRRADVGFDSLTYVEYFHIFRTRSLTESLRWDFEPGYIILNKVIGLFTQNTQVFLIIICLVTLIPPLVMIWKKSDIPLLSLLLFVVMGHWYSTMGIFRQWCAIAVLIYAYHCIVNRQLVRFIVATAVAYTFHQTALFVIPLYFLYPLRITPFKVVCCLAVAIMMSLFANQIMALLNTFARLETAVMAGGGFTYLIVMWIIIFLIMFLAQAIVNEKDMKLYFMALIYSATIQPLSLTYGAFSRIHLYCWIGMVLGIPRFLKALTDEVDSRNTYLFKLAVIAVFALWYWVTIDHTAFYFV